ncbi:MAG: hypothetical protein AAGE52_37160, partial [Myxococcota bacterium]
SFVQVEPSLRSCTGPGTLFVDADIDGADGRIVSYVLSGEAAAQTDRACVTRTLQSLRYPRFNGRVRVRWAVTK